MAEQSVEKKTFFSDMDPKFPPVVEDKPLETHAFLEAAKNVPLFFDTMGAAFKPIKSDVSGNITKLEKIYNKDTEKYSTFKAMLAEDVEEKKTRDSNGATIALLWLKRALQFMAHFLKAIAEDADKTERLVPFVGDAYEKVLKPYHGFLARGAFTLVSKATPNRKDLLKSLAFKKEGLDDEVISGMAEFVAALQANLDQIQALYKEMDLDFTDKV